MARLPYAYYQPEYDLPEFMTENPFGPPSRRRPATPYGTSALEQLSVVPGRRPRVDELLTAERRYEPGTAVAPTDQTTDRADSPVSMEWFDEYVEDMEANRDVVTTYEDWRRAQARIAETPPKPSVAKEGKPAEERPMSTAPIVEVTNPQRGPLEMPPRPEEPPKPSEAKEGAPKTYHDVADRVIKPDPEGTEGDPFGMETENRWTRARAVQQAGTAYGPGERPGSRRWEDEFVRDRQRLTDQDIRTRMGIYAFTMSPENQMAMYDRMRQEQESYRQGLAEARARDQADAPVSRALAQAVASSGMVSPEEAANLRVGDPVVKAFLSGAYGQGTRGESLQQRWVTDLLQVLADRAKSEEREEGQTTRSRERNAAIIAQSQGKRGNAEEEERLVSNWISGRVPDKPWPRELAVAYLRTGDPKYLPKGISKAEADRLVIEGRATYADPTKRHLLTPTPAAVANRERERETLPFKSGTIKARESIASITTNLVAAAKAWKQMPRSQQEAFVRWGRDAPNWWTSTLSWDGDKSYQRQAVRLHRLLGVLRRENYGLSQTLAEIRGQALETGMALDTWDPFRDPGGLEEALEALREATAARHQVWKSLERQKEK